MLESAGGDRIISWFAHTLQQLGGSSCSTRGFIGVALPLIKVSGTHCILHCNAGCPPEFEAPIHAVTRDACAQT